MELFDLWSTIFALTGLVLISRLDKQIETEKTPKNGNVNQSVNQIK